jgi:hypothetical protein
LGDGGHIFTLSVKDKLKRFSSSGNLESSHFGK